ncbi:hypothetical protein EOM71_02215, partial [Candidatus Falkowbacteria bacterium]|nr:hypothetical protein [Candidatus Falkowbacteria bacterium]
MLELSKIKQRKFTNSFLLIVLAVIFCTFVALKIYQTMDDQQPVTLKNDEQASIAQDLQESNQ